MRQHTILVPYDRSEGAADMLRLACQVATVKGGKVVVLATTEVHRALPLHDLPRYLDEQSSNAIAHACAVVSQFDVKIESRVRHTYDAAKTIIEQADAADCDAIFLAVTRPRFSRFLQRLSRKDRFILFHAPCPVLLGHMPASYFLDATGVLAEVDRMFTHAS